MAEITDFGPRKTFFILAIVFGCFTVLWPKILQPMFVGFVTPHHSASDGSGKTGGCTPKAVGDVRKKKSLKIARYRENVMLFTVMTEITGTQQKNDQFSITESETNSGNKFRFDIALLYHCRLLKNINFCTCIIQLKRIPSFPKMVSFCCVPFISAITVYKQFGSSCHTI